MMRVWGPLMIEGRRDTWYLPMPPMNWELVGVDGEVLAKFADRERSQSLLVSAGTFNGVVWVHSSIAGIKSLPTYADLATLKGWVFGPEGIACQVFPQSSQHVNIHPNCLHLWGPLDPQDWPLPHFGAGGSI